ncbi:AAA family ATPase [Flavobacterium psychrophilum]|uniref:AAA family ATPase n=1 Tax=Flavobacterium psychrophilum TaxID=96345 RepID=UPI001D09801B|nr:AAA family ATPase [Flavobacterium psychrophilum]MCB6097213.1 ATP-binding protein [Flavobacterium psychrophilum]
MTPTTKQQIVQELENYLVKYKMSANVFAAKSGINEAYISNMRNGTYMIVETEIAPRWFDKVAQFIGLQLTKSYWNPVATNQMSAMLAILEDSKEHGLTNVVIGETGCGKTYTSSLFAKSNPHDSFIIKVGSSDNLSDLIDKILEIAKIPYAKTKSKNINGIVKFMQKQKFDGQKPQLIFDECEYMRQPTLGMMKEFYDDLSGHCSIVLIGTDELIDNLDKLRKRKKAGMRQFYRRIKFGIRVLPTIDKTFKGFLNTIEDKPLKTFLQRNCENYGELHDVLVPAMREADRTGEPLTEQFVRKVLNIPNNMFT